MREFFDEAYGHEDDILDALNESRRKSESGRYEGPAKVRKQSSKKTKVVVVPKEKKNKLGYEGCVVGPSRQRHAQQ